MARRVATNQKSPPGKANNTSSPTAYRGDFNTEIWVPPNRPAKSRSGLASLAKLIFGLIILGFVCSLVGIFSISALFYFSDTIFPGLRVGDSPLGGLTREEAAAVLDDWPAVQTILLVHADQSWPVNAADLGIILDKERTLANALAAGRTLESLLGIMAGDRQVEPAWTLEPRIARAYLENMAPQTKIEPRNARVVIDQGVARATPPVDGQVLDLEKSVAALEADPGLILKDGRLSLVMQPLAANRADVSDLVNQAQLLLSGQITLIGFDPVSDERRQWTIGPDSWQGWLSLEVDPEKDQPFNWIVEEEAARNFLTAGLPSLGSDRYLQGEALLPVLTSAIATGQEQVYTRIYHHPRQHVVLAGETLSSIGRDYGIPYPWIQQANPNSDFLAAGDTITIPSPDALLPLPVVENKRIVVSIGRQQVSVYENDQLKWDWPASTGIDSSPTAPGVFQVQSHSPNAYAENWDLWMPHFMGIYRPVPEFSFMNGFHGFPTRNGTNLLWTGNLGSKVTYGCILLSSENAAMLYDWAEEGVVVEITP